MFVDTTRSVSVVIGEKDNKQVSEKWQQQPRILLWQVLKKRNKEVRKEEQKHRKANRHREDKIEKAAEEVMSGEIEWEVYYSKVCLNDNRRHQ
jgi:hypothetical protein